jgi:hypothetical protein
MTPILTDHTLTLGDYSEELPRLATPARVHVWSVPPEYRASGYFISVQAAGQPLELPACDARDAQPLTTLELPADAGANIDAARAERLAAANAEADRLLTELSATYPDREVISWDQQIREATAYTADATVATPLLSALAAARGVALADLVQKVQAKALAFSAASGRILGARQRLEDQLGAAETVEAIAAVPSLAGVLADLPAAAA